MQAIVKEQRAPGLKVATVAKPAAGPGEVLIAVRHAGVCGTDLHIADWDPWAQGRLKPPLVIGHEFAGEIVAVGDGVAELKRGQLVTARATSCAGTACSAAPETGTSAATRASSAWTGTGRSPSTSRCL